MIWLVQVDLEGKTHYFIIDAATLSKFDEVRHAGRDIPKVTAVRSFASRSKAKAWCRAVAYTTSSRTIWQAWLAPTTR